MKDLSSREVLCYSVVVSEGIGNVYSALTASLLPLLLVLKDSPSRPLFLDKQNLLVCSPFASGPCWIR
jgi:hypothetical protein